MLAMEATSLRFAAAARTLGDAARRQGLCPPGFRSPPRTAGLDRAIKRQLTGAVMVSIRLKDRPWVAVLADMVDGVVAANDLLGAEASSVRAELWRALQGQLGPALETPPPVIERLGPAPAGMQAA